MIRLSTILAAPHRACAIGLTGRAAAWAWIACASGVLHLLLCVLLALAGGNSQAAADGGQSTRQAAAPTPPLAARLPALRQAVAADPQRALGLLAALRQDAVAAGDLATRLAVDEIECRAAGDQDSARGLAVARAGLAAVGAQPPVAARANWLRLRACQAGILLDLGKTEAGQAELAQLLALPDDGADALPRALALMERGVWRSRSGLLIDGQADLLAACQRLQPSELQEDHALCSLHLSSHHRRMGDADEAIRLLQPLLAQAQQAGALYDTSVYVYSLARALQQRGDWPAAQAAYRKALQAAEQLRDANGIAYAEQGLARALLETGQPEQALPHARRSLQAVDPATDPRETILRTVTLAEAQLRLGQAGGARATLDSVATAARQAGQLPLLASWLVVRADTAARLAQWPEAHAALSEARQIEQQVHQQQLSEQAGRLRQQFHRARDAEELDALRQLNAQGQRLRQTQLVAIGLALLLGLAAAGLAAHKVRQARALKLQSETDELTGLANRRALQAFAARHWARRQADTAAGPASVADGNRDLAVLAIDVDHFKRVNDRYGHAAGDAVLRQLAATLGRFMRSRDRVGRIGGEEFVAVLPGAGADTAREVAERIRAAVATTPADAGGAGALAVTISIGVAVAGPDDASFDTLLARADAALYRAKTAGRNRVCDAAQPTSPQAQQR